MTDHLDLVALLRGELSNAEVTEVADHLDRCDECRRELADAAIGHALLTGTTGGLTRPPRLELHEVPSPGFATPSPCGRAWLRPLGLVAAAAALVAGTAVITQWPDRSSGPRRPVATPERTADLEPVEGTGSGRVVMAQNSHDGVRMVVETRGLPRISRGHFYEVWLFNPKTQKRLALGMLGPGGAARFDVAGSLMGRYQDIDVSLERDDGDPGHSVTSVLRAKYA